MSFDLKKFLTENKLTKTAKISENTEPTKSSENWRDNLGPNFHIDPTSVNLPRNRTYGARVFKIDPNIVYSLEGERQVLRMAYELLKKDSGVKTARYYHLYDEDYPSDVISDYFELQRDAAKNNERPDSEDTMDFLTGVETTDFEDKDLKEGKNNLKQNNMSFDLKKFLTENKLTKSSRLAENDLAFEAEEMQAPVAEEPAAEGVDVSRYLNLESADDVVKEIESEVARVTMEAKISKIKEVIEAIETKANGLEEDANLEGFVNPTRIKEMRRMTKKLRMMQERYTKEYERKFKEGKKKKLNEQFDNNRMMANINALNGVLKDEVRKIVGAGFDAKNQDLDYSFLTPQNYSDNLLLTAMSDRGGIYFEWMAKEQVDEEEYEMIRNGYGDLEMLAELVDGVFHDHRGTVAEQNEESDLKIRTVSRADAGKAIRGTTQKKPMVGADYKGMKGTQVQTVKRPVAFRAMKDAKDGLGPQYKK